MSPTDRWAGNPFYVLSVPAGSTPREIERAGQKLLGQIELGVVSSLTYATPFGTRRRTADDVRQALADLREPDRRAVAQVWAAHPPAEPLEEALAPWEGALAAFGWRSSSR